MIYAEFEEYPHLIELVQFLRERFSQVDYGSQCDDWIWITDQQMKVSIDNFTSHGLQIKAPVGSKTLLTTILEAVGNRYDLRLMDPPEWEGHESEDPE